MSVSFVNPGEIDINAAVVMGVNAKETSGSPIGQFGTGLKYAIAVLLRSGHQVAIHSGLSTRMTFTTRSMTTRGQQFDLVCGNGVSLGFTTDLGKHWPLWMAFRELKSNAMDEGGDAIGTLYAPTRGETVITVIGRGMDQVWAERDKFFLKAAPPLAAYGGVEVHLGEGIYMRGILVAQVKTSWAYNLTETEVLNEDRGFKDLWSVGYRIANALKQFDDPQILDKVLLDGGAEKGFPWFSGSLAKAARSVVRKHLEAKSLPKAFASLEADSVEPVPEPDPREASEAELGMILQAERELSYLGLSFDPESIQVSPQAGAVLGFCKAGKVYLCEGVFAMGQTMVTGTVLEELLHRDFALEDCKRSMQNHLLNLLATLVGKLNAEGTPTVAETEAFLAANEEG